MTHLNEAAAAPEAAAHPADSGPSGRPIPTDLNAMLTGREAAALLGLSVRTLESARVKGGGPPYRKLFNSVRYERRALLEWAAARTRRSTSDDARAAL